MAVYACSSTITNQTVPSISISPSVSAGQTLVWDATLQVFVNADITVNGSTPFSGIRSGTGGALEPGEVSLDGGTVAGDDSTFILKTLKPGPNLNLVDNGTSITVELSNSGSLLNTGNNVGTGAQVYKDASSNILNFRSIVGGTGVTVTQGTDEITISASGEVNTASNLGTGTNIFNSKVGTDLQFRSIAVSGQLTISEANDTITIGADFGIDNTNEGEILIGDSNGNLVPLTGGVSGSYLYYGTTGPQWSAAGQVSTNRTFRITFEQDGSLENFHDVPSDITVSRIGNTLTVQHSFNTWPKVVTYYGYDSIQNKFKYRQPTGNYQVLLDGTNPTSEFDIQVNAAVAGADVSGYAYVNLVF